MEVLFERVAGLDIGKASLTVCVRTPGLGGRRSSETRTVKTTTRALRVMRNWLLGAGVTMAAMESTSSSWKAPFYCLEEVMEVWLLNAAHMKAVPGRKTDANDAEWIAQLLRHGLLRPSFVPPPDIRRLRDADPLPGAADGRPHEGGDPAGADARGRLDQAVLGRLQPDHRLRTGDAGRTHRGERDERVLAQLAKGRMRVKIPELTEALIGHFDDHHARLARAILNRLKMVEAALAELDAVLEDAFAPWARQMDLLQTIPGVGLRVAQVIIAETGADMSRFPSAAHLAAWAGVAPAIYESAGRRSPAGARHGNKWLNHMLVEAAGSVARMKGAN